jgi:hypothetical protein
MNRLFVALVVFLIGVGSPSRADHLSHNLAAQGKPETKLAGINLRNATLADIVRRYGPPTKVQGVEEHDPGIASSFDYYWIKSGMHLHILVERFPNKLPDWQYVSLIEVNSSTVNRIGRTGRGLKLGDSLDDLKRIYGPRYYVRNISKFKIHDVMIQWRREEYSLVATLDQNNRITKLSLAAPE